MGSRLGGMSATCSLHAHNLSLSPCAIYHHLVVVRSIREFDAVLAVFELRGKARIELAQATRVTPCEAQAAQRCGVGGNGLRYMCAHICEQGVQRGRMITASTPRFISTGLPS